mmetsp:Transcript_89397/g.261337  ORF Transcript_89397/g.261337 Transcript_89397/m.261337 type:complete len:454 (-) Transcript_89397:556-1917(-)
MLCCPAMAAGVAVVAHATQGCSGNRGGFTSLAVRMPRPSLCVVSSEQIAPQQGLGMQIAAGCVGVGLAAGAVSSHRLHRRRRRQRQPVAPWPVPTDQVRAAGVVARWAGPVEKEASRGKVAVVTGASVGVGKATVDGLARSGQFSHIILAGRNATKHEQALEDLGKVCGQAGKGAELKHLELDLGSLNSVKAFVNAFEALKLPSLDVLVLNAGIMMLPERFVTEDGFERQMGVNHCGHFALTNLLLPRLVASGSSSSPSRIISLSSSAHLADCPLGNGQLGDLMWNEKTADYSPGAAYAQSKLANVLMVYELNRRAQEDGLPIAANVVHPGGVQTDLGRYLIEGMADPESGDLSEKALNMPAWQEALIRGVVNTFITPKTPAEGARTSVMLATCSPEEVQRGLYWEDERPTPSLGKAFNPLSPGTSYDEELWRGFWDLSEEWTGVRYCPRRAD